MLTSQPERPPLCATAPLLWGLIPLMLGIVCANGSRPGFAGVCILLMIIFTLPWLRLRGVPFVASFLLGFCCLRMYLDEPHPDWRVLPPREAELSIEAVELFNTRKAGFVSGIGKILQSDVPHETLTGNNISFYLENPGGPPVLELAGESFTCIGMVTFLPALEQQDDFQTYLKSREVFLTVGRGSIRGIISPATGLQQARSRHFSRFQKILRGDPEKGWPGNVLASMLLGDRRLLTDEQIDLYRNSGTYHLFAVSGLHVGCMGVFIAGLLRLLQFKERWSLPLVLLTVWYYVWLTGSSPSSVRSGIMITCLMSSRLLMRQGHLFPALVVSAWLVLLVDPRQLFSLGFQLSYAVVASIILIGLPLAGFLTRSLRKHLTHGGFMRKPSLILARAGRALIEVSSVSLSAGCVSMPLIVQHFNLYTPAGMILGILLNPLASATIMTGCLVMLLAPLFPATASMTATLAWPMIRLMEGLIGISMRIPGAYSSKAWCLPHAGSWLVILTILVAWFLQYLRQQHRDRHAISYFIPLLIVFAGLGFGLVDA